MRICPNFCSVSFSFGHAIVDCKRLGIHKSKVNIENERPKATSKFVAKDESKVSIVHGTVSEAEAIVN